MTKFPRFNLERLQHAVNARGLATSIDLDARGLRLRQSADSPAPEAPRRSKIWDLNRNFHCSIIGTCLSTGELKQILIKAGLATDGVSDHQLHGQGVLLAAQRDSAAKLLNKALDKRHKTAINQFAKAKTASEVRALWAEAAKRGEIPGAYWAALTHPAADEDVIRDVFGEVHMISHLVGASNRADIRRLNELETENVALREKLQRQQEQLRDGLTSRDAKIRDLNALLARRISENGFADETDEKRTLTKLVTDLEQRLAGEARRRQSIEKQLQRASNDLAEERRIRNDAEQRAHVLSQELDALEADILPHGGDDGDKTILPPISLDGISLLYVGGRQNQLNHLRTLGEHRGLHFLHHDGGIEERGGLLEGLVSRADVVVFPVDCVSHQAVAIVKRLCRRMEKPYVPLRSGGISSFVTALKCLGPAATTAM